MLVAAPAFVLLGGLAVSHVMDIYCKDLWLTSAAGSAETGEAGTATAAAAITATGPKRSKSRCACIEFACLIAAVFTGSAASNIQASQMYVMTCILYHCALL